MVKKAILFLSAALSLGSVAIAQPCATDQQYKLYKEQFPKIAEFEKQLNEQMRKMDLAQYKTTADDSFFHIPVVVHVIHDYATSNYVADDNIYALIDDINEIYRGGNSDLSEVIQPFKKYIGVPKIKFHLATKDPLGRPTKGITHRYTYLTNGGDDQAKFDLWAPNSYLNIWLINKIGRGISNGEVLAYATFPSSAAAFPYNDGVIAKAASINGTTKTIAHEIGHFFNLSHPWGNGEVATACGDDDVDDTPPTKGHFGATGDCNKPSVLYDTSCIYNSAPLGRAILDTTFGQPIRSSNDNGVGIDFIARTALYLDTVNIYPTALNKSFDIALLKYNTSANRFDTISRYSDTVIKTVGRPAPNNSMLVPPTYYTSPERAGIAIESLAPFRIESVDIYPSTIGDPFRIVLLNNTDTVGSYSGLTATNTGAQTVPLNFFVAKDRLPNPPIPGSNYRLVVVQNPGLIRDSLGSNPIALGDSVLSGIVRLKRATDTALAEHRSYNYMYNWKIRFKGLTYTDSSAQPVPLKWYILPDSGYRLSVIQNPGLKNDSVASILYSRDISCIVTMQNELTANRYNYIYNWRLRYGYVKNCIDYPDTTNTQNIMDYADCPKNFTTLQVKRMRDALSSNVGNRDNLTKLQTHINTGIYDPATQSYDVKVDLPIVPDFSVERTGTLIKGGSHYMCANESEFSFRNRSWGDTLESLKFEFANGNPATSTVSNAAIKVKITQPGWVNVTLTAKGNNTQEIKLERTPVYAADPEYKLNPFTTYQEFGDSTENSKWPIFNYYNNDFKWQVIHNAGYYDNSCITYTGYDKRSSVATYTGTPNGDYDDFFTPAFNLTEMKDASNCNLNFMSSGAFRVSDPALMDDELEIAYSTDCGANWAILDSLHRSEIANKGSYQGEYAPLWTGDWVLTSIDIPKPARTERTFFRFRYKPSADMKTGYLAAGNNYYIDRINVSNFPLGVNTLIDDKKNIVVAPNPTTGNAFVVIKNSNEAQAQVMVTDITGKVVYRTEASLSGSVSRIEIPASALAVKGIYLVHVTTGGQSHTEKLVAQ